MNMLNQKANNEKIIFLLIFLVFLFGCRDTNNLETNKNIDWNICEKIGYNGNPRDKVDIVFIPDHYSINESNLFFSDVNEHIDLGGINYGLLSVEPIKSNRNKFNFYRVNSFNLSCYEPRKEYSTKCKSKVQKIASLCPQTEVRIVLVNKNITGVNIGEAYRGGLPDNFIIVDRTKPKTTVHEFGHAFGGLGDEYINIKFQRPITDLRLKPNCDVEGCPKWCSGKLNTSNSICYVQYTKYEECIENGNSGTYCYDSVSKIDHKSFSLEDCNFGIDCEEGTGCYWNCQGGKLFRPSKRGIMYDSYSEPFEFNKVDQKIILNKLLKFK